MNFKKQKSKKCVLVVFKLIINFCMLACFCLICFMALSNRGRLVNAFAFEFNIVQSESMQKTVNKYDFVLVVKTNPQKLKVGEIVVFFDQTGKYKILHRIHGIIQQENKKLFITKGDNNNLADDGVRQEKDIYAKCIFKLPYLGLLLTFLLSPQGITVALINVCNLLFLLLIWSESDKLQHTHSYFKKTKARAFGKSAVIIVLN